VADQSLLDILPEKVRFILSGSAKDWETARETFSSDLTSIMTHMSQQRTSKENLLAASSTTLWLLSNLTRADLHNGDDLWTNFVPILNEFARDYRGRLDNESYLKMKDTVNMFMREIGEERKDLRQPIPGEIEEKALLRHYSDLAKNLEDEFRLKLSFQKEAICNLKAEKRVIEKANLPKTKGGYDGDYSCVLDYLRGTVFIDVDKSTSSVLLKEKYDLVIANLTTDIGSIERRKVFQMDNDQGPPRFLLNLRFNNNSLQKDLICEVQIRFSLYGFDPDFQDFLHLVYELERKPKKEINWKPHILQLSREMLQKTGIVFTDGEFDNFQFAQHVEIQYVKGDRQDKDALKIVFVNNQGTDIEVISEMNFKVSFILDRKTNRYKTVFGDPKKYQFELVRT
jgi:hypothetical protein